MIGFSLHTLSQPLALYCTGLVPWKWFSIKVLPRDDAFLSKLSPAKGSNYVVVMFDIVTVTCDWLSCISCTDRS